MNSDSDRTAQLLLEAGNLKRRVAELEAIESSRRQVETILRENEENYRVFCNTIDSLLWVFDMQGNILWANETVSLRLGYTADELRGQNILMVHPPDRREEVGRIVKAMLEGKVDYCPVPVLTKDGRQISVETRVTKGKWSGRDVVFGVTNDISEIKASEEKLSKAFQASPSLMAISEVDSRRYVDVNEFFLKVTGYTRAEVIGKSSLDLGIFIHPEQRETLLDVLMRGGTVRDVEAELRTKSGEIRFGLFSLEFIELQDKKLLLSVMSDITTRKQIEEALRQSEARLDVLFSQSMDGFFFMLLDEPVYWNDSVDKEQVLDYVFAHQHTTKINDAMLTQYKATREQFLGLTPNDFFQHDLEQGKLAWRNFFDEGHLHIDTDERKFDGTHMWIEGDYICMYDSQERIIGHFGIQRDVSDRKKLQEELQTEHDFATHVMNSMGQGLTVLDQRGEFEFVNPAYARLIGRTQVDIVGKKPLNFNHPDDVEILKKSHRKRKSGKSNTYQIRLLHADGSAVPVLITGVPRLKQEKYIGSIAVITDLSEQKTAEKKLRRVNEQLRIQVKEIERLQSTLREEAIRDPLTNLFNRRYLHETMIRELHICKREKKELCVIMMDIDHFKKINDKYGHSVGDQFLIALADLIKDYARGSDIACRYGGEEFLLVMPGANARAAARRAEEIRKKCAEIHIPHGSKKLNITLSLGVAGYPAHAKDTQEIIVKADQALYLSKSSGRNCVTVWNAVKK